MPERIKLKITEVGEPKEVGSKGAKKLTFKAKGADSKELPYFTFRPTLFDLIKTGAELEAEVDTKTREYEGNTYTDRQVNQIFIEGQPASGEKKQGGRGKSPEERQSIAEQVAVKAVVELVACGAIPHNHPLFKGVLDWCWEKLLPNAVKPALDSTESSKMPSFMPDKPPPVAVKGETGIMSPIGSTSSLPVEKLLSNVAEVKGFKTTKTARTFLMNVCHISGDRIESEPEKVWQEVKDKI